MSSEDRKHEHGKSPVYRTALWTEHILDILEIVLAIAVVAGFLLTFVLFIRELPGMLASENGGEAFHEFLEFALNLAVGIEFVKMLIKHTPGAALEVLLFAIARHMVLDSGSAVGNLLGVAAIGGIFAIRRFIYVHSFLSKHDDSSFDWLSGELREEAQKNAIRRSILEKELSATDPQDDEDADTAKEAEKIASALYHEKE